MDASAEVTAAEFAAVASVTERWMAAESGEQLIDRFALISDGDGTIAVVEVLCGIDLQTGEDCRKRIRHAYRVFSRLHCEFVAHSPGSGVVHSASGQHHAEAF